MPHRLRADPRPLPDVTSARRWRCLSGCAIDYRRPCTSDEGRLCDIFRELDSWNELFWHVRLELRELSPGQLSLVEGYSALPSGRTEQERQATALLFHLLTLHRCVISVTLNDDVIRLNDRLICDALRQSSNLRKLDISGCDYVDKTKSYRLIAVLPHLTQLEELVLQSLTSGYASSQLFAEFLASTRSLTTLSMTYWKSLQRNHALIVVRGLEQNKTITTLSLSMDIVNKFWSSRNATIAFFHVSTLRKLSVRPCMNCRDTARQIVKPMLFNNTISELNLTEFSITIANIRLIAELLIQNGTLTSLNFICCDYMQDNADSRVTYTENFGYVSSRIYPWVVAFAENKALEELTLSLSWYDAEDWRSFFKALASNASLKKVKVCQFPRKDVAEIFRAMRETGVQGRFVGVRTACTERFDAENDSTAFPAFEPLPRTASLLQSCSHVTSLCIVSEKEISNVLVSSVISQCITGTTALRELEVICRMYSSRWYADNTIQKALVEGMSTNNTIRSLYIWGLNFDETETQMLAETLQSSRTLCHFCFSPLFDSESMLSLLWKLSPNMSSNYTLLTLYLNKMMDLSGDLFTVPNVVRRNNSLVTRATDFVMGRTRHKYCAAALELVHSTPGLVARVQNSASVDENEAALMIKRSLNSFSEMDDFMRVTGVVKDGVTCHRREDGVTQLTDLNTACWLNVRQYLKVSDIQDIQ
ncbi:hypothetical protein MTO96_000757 [Rhipicephalus appendiculatus]